MAKQLKLVELLKDKKTLQEAFRALKGEKISAWEIIPQFEVALAQKDYAVVIDKSSLGDHEFIHPYGTRVAYRI